jgi:hypothetical protein
MSDCKSVPNVWIVLKYQLFFERYLQIQHLRSFTEWMLFCADISKFLVFVL